MSIHGHIFTGGLTAIFIAAVSGLENVTSSKVAECINSGVSIGTHAGVGVGLIAATGVIGFVRMAVSTDISNKRIIYRTYTPEGESTPGY